MQGGTPPPSAPPVPPTFGPTLPPGYQRTFPPSGGPRSQHQPPSSQNNGGTRPTAPDRLRSTFKCPKFLGEVRHWKVWNQGFVRFLSINMLDYVIEEGFAHLVLTVSQQEDNKLVYYILEDAVAGSTTAAKYVRRAALWNGHEAYHLLYTGFALSGPANAAILLAELSNFRFKTDETPSEVMLRLQELFDDLESLPGNAAVAFNSTQKINYLLSAIRPERALAPVYAQIQTAQVRGQITFEQACDELHYRDEAMRADDLLKATHLPTKIRGLAATADPPTTTPAVTTPALITTADKRQNKVAVSPKPQVACLVKGCDAFTSARFRLCKTCYHECIAGKTPTLLLKSGEKATFDPTTQRINFPPSVGDKTSRKVKAAVTFLPGASTSE
jgi:hypothetical protein